MATLGIRKVSSWPQSPLEANTIYIVNSSATEAEMYITNNTGTITARQLVVVGNITESKQSTLNLSSGFYQTEDAEYESIIVGSNTASGNKFLREINISLVRMFDTVVIRVLVRNLTNNNNKLGSLRFWTTDVNDSEFLEIQSVGTAAYTGVYEVTITYVGAGNYMIFGQVGAGVGFVSSLYSSFSKQISLTSNWRPRVDFLSGLVGSSNYGGNTQIQYYIDYKRADDYILV